jgi:hypothetical protein
MGSSISEHRVPPGGLLDGGSGRQNSSGADWNLLQVVETLGVSQIYIAFLYLIYMYLIYM